MYKFNVEIKLDTEEKLESDFIEGLTELLNDEIGDVCKVSVKEDTKWQELKEWASYLCYFELLDKMQELEAEDVEN